jgi:hypothetical protein
MLIFLSITMTQFIHFMPFMKLETLFYLGSYDFFHQAINKTTGSDSE